MEIDTPYQYSGPAPVAVYYGPGAWYPGYAAGWGPSFSLVFNVGSRSWQQRPFAYGGQVRQAVSPPAGWQNRPHGYIGNAGGSPGVAYAQPQRQFAAPQAQQRQFAAPQAQQRQFAAPPVQQQRTFAAPPVQQQRTFAAPVQQQRAFAPPAQQRRTFAAPQRTFSAPAQRSAHPAPAARGQEQRHR
jgi:hypothetical protein